MNELIKITTNEQGSQVVSARELYTHLGYDMTNWAKWYIRNITNNNYAIVGEDFIPLVLGTNANKSKNMDFALSIDFAKRLSMMAKTEKGEQVRQYFLECEKIAREKQQALLPSNYIDALKALVAAEEQKLLAERKAENLNTALDNLLEWVSIIKIAMHNKIDEKIFNWRVLKKRSEELGYGVKRAASPRFGYQNLYHIDAFRSCYPQYDYNIKETF